MYFDPKKKRMLLVTTFAGIFTIVAAVIGTVAAIYAARFFMIKNPHTEAVGPIIASIMNTIQIQFWAQIYTLIAKRLNDMENHA